MTSTIEKRKIKELVADYAKEGYEVFIAPTGKELPAALQLHQGRFDFIAVRNGDARVVKVATTPSLSKSLYLKELAETIERMEGWTFDLVITNIKSRKMREDEAFEDLPLAEIQERLLEAKELNATKFKEAALLTAWSAFESASRTLLRTEYPTLKVRTTSTVLIKQLFGYGIIGRSDYDWLRKATNFRSYVAHGFEHKSKTVEQQDVVKLIQLTEQLTAQIKK